LANDEGIVIRKTSAGVVELVDAPDSKSGSGDRVSVRFRPPAPVALLTPPFDDIAYEIKTFERTFWCEVLEVENLLRFFNQQAKTGSPKRDPHAGSLSGRTALTALGRGSEDLLNRRA
jgi:hypothetical protein